MTRRFLLLGYKRKTVDFRNRFYLIKSFVQTFLKVWPPAGSGTGLQPIKPEALSQQYCPLEGVLVVKTINPFYPHINNSNRWSSICFKTTLQPVLLPRYPDSECLLSHLFSRRCIFFPDASFHFVSIAFFFADTGVHFFTLAFIFGYIAFKNIVVFSNI